jgi:hypothetical protein
MANAKGFMKKRGIEMSIARGFGSFASAQSISGGQFDCGLCAAPALTLSVAKGLPLIALATTDYDATMGVGVLADSPIQKPQDLAGKKIASVPTSAEFPFLPGLCEESRSRHQHNRVGARRQQGDRAHPHRKAGGRDHQLCGQQLFDDDVERRAKPLDALQLGRHQEPRSDDLGHQGHAGEGPRVLRSDGRRDP